MDLYLHPPNGKPQRHHINPQQAIAKGGEADIFRLRNGEALKLFKSPNHPDYSQDAIAQDLARQRLAEHQTKLRQFPRPLPDGVVTPQALACDRTGNILGYTMTWIDGATPLMSYGDRAFRQASGITPRQVLHIFHRLWKTLSKLHFAGVVVGDVNDLNVLIQGDRPYLIDSDSFQFGGFPCRMFTLRYLDPLRLGSKAVHSRTSPAVSTPESDWYAFTALLMQSLLYVHPYGGVYKPKNPADKMPHDDRPHHRITVFHPQVKYPKPAIPYRMLADEWLHYFHQVFEKDVRGEFPEALLQSFRWTTCSTCGTEHGRDRCPNCTQTTVAIPKPMITVRGAVTANRIFSTEGVILNAAYQQGRLRWVYGDRHAFWRDDGRKILEGELNPHLRFWLQGDTTWIGQGQQVIGLHGDRPPERLAVDCRGTVPLFAATPSAWYRVHQDRLERSDSLGWNPDIHHPTGRTSMTVQKATSQTSQPQDAPNCAPTAVQSIGTVIAEQTYFWVGPTFGFGFYRAGQLSTGFVFDAHRPGLKDRVLLNLGTGHILDARCAFGPDRVWFFLATQEQGKICHRCAVIGANGEVMAIAQAKPQENHWFSTLGGCAVGDFLLTPIDEGIVRVEPHNGQLVLTQTFPDTEPFVDAQSLLIPGDNALYVVNPHEIFALKIS